MEFNKKVFAFVLCLLFTLSVKAEVKVELGCNNTNVNVGSSISCNVNLVYEQESIKEVSFRYSTDLGITFNETNVTQNVNSVTINFNDMLQATDKKTTTIATMNISASNGLSTGEHIISLENVSYKKEDNSIVNIANASKPINVFNSSNSLINGITINGTAISNFSPEVLVYDNITVSEQSVFIDVVKNVEQLTITGAGTIRVREGQSVTRIIHVESATESIDYTLVITNRKEDAAPLPDVASKSGDNTLKSLEIYYDGNRLDFKYDPTKTSFMYVVKDNTIDKIELKATINDSKAHYDDLYFPKEYEIDFGLNNFEILVIAENNDLRVYSLNIVREDFRDSENGLSSIKVKNKVIELNDDKSSYEISARGKITKDDIEAIAKSSKAKITYNEIRLADDGSEDINITVTAENGDEKDYNLTVKPLEDGEVEDIIISKYYLGFNPETMSYDINLKNDEKALEITILPNDLDYEVIGNENLKDGSKITIRFNYQNEIKDYIITVHKKGNGLPAVVCYLIFILGIGALVASIIYFKKVTK